MRPLGIVHGCRVKEIVNSGRGLPLTESGAFTSCQMIVRDKKGERVDELAVTSLTDWQKKNGTYLSRLLEKIVGRIGNTRQTIVGHSLSNPLIVGIVNITPDSFSDGGEYQTVLLLSMLVENRPGRAQILFRQMWNKGELFQLSARWRGKGFRYQLIRTILKLCWRQ